MAADRVKRLKDLIDVVMRLPESPERDRLLSEVRSRAVDLDTGVTPRAMLPLQEPALAPAPRLPKRRAVMPPAPPRAASLSPSRPAPAPRSTADLDWDKVLSETALLSLDDAPNCWPAPKDDRSAARPWAVGLRG
jgi:hypothetical protein